MSYFPGRKQMRHDIIQYLKKHDPDPVRAKKIASDFGIEDRKAYQQFQSVLAEMESKNVVGKASGGKYTLRSTKSITEGTLHVNAKGFGFVDVEGMDDDLFVREVHMGTALDGDIVRVVLGAPARGDRRREAKVEEVIQRNRSKVVGTFTHKGDYAFVVPDDQRVTQDIYVPSSGFNGARDGQKVVASIDKFESRQASPEGRILQIIGDSEDPEVRVLSVALSLDVRADFPDEVEAEASKIPDEIPERVISERLDLRDKFVFTIDPEDAKDFDDALHFEEKDNGHYEVGVHIADVSHYVRPGTTLDKEGYQRGTSVYLVDRTIPMLPEKLSNVVCSLRPREDKLAYSCIMEINSHGEVVDYEIAETVIHSDHRFTYEEAQQFIDGGYPSHPAASRVVKANRLAKTLTKKRMRTGSVDFDLPEVRVVLDDQGHPVDIVKKERKPANRLIEEFMLLANKTVARHIGDHKNAKPFVYRIHEKPDSERIQQLVEYVRAFGYDVDLQNGNIESSVLNRLLSKVKGRPESTVIESAALRSMAKARYSTQNVGHYGLGFSFYSHFTSPIRRYPDLMVHRLLKKYGEGAKKSNIDALESKCEHCSKRERVAVEAERESVKLKQVEYVRQHLGESFDGVVTGVTNFGIFVEITDLLVEGLVHISDLDDDYYEYDEDNYSLIGSNTGKTYKPGTSVRVMVAGANVEKRQVDLMLA